MRRFVVSSTLAIVAGLALSAWQLASPANAHRSGSWLYPPQVAQKLNGRGFDGPTCIGKGSFRHTVRSSPNDRQSWQYKHFECSQYTGVGYPGIVVACVHSLADRRIAISRVMRNNAYMPCRF
jgi:hypothetical protein